MNSFKPQSFIFQHPIYFGYSVANIPHQPASVFITIFDTESYTSFAQKKEGLIRMIQRVPMNLQVNIYDVSSNTDTETFYKPTPIAGPQFSFIGMKQTPYQLDVGSKPIPATLLGNNGIFSPGGVPLSGPRTISILIQTDESYKG